MQMRTREGKKEEIIISDREEVEGVWIKMQIERRKMNDKIYGKLN